MQKDGFVIAFDVDGTLEYGDPKGPVELKRVKELKDEGFTVGIIGAKEKVEHLIPGLDFYYRGDSVKFVFLKEVKEKFSSIIGIYVADMESDRRAALEAGFCFINANDFR